MSNGKIVKRQLHGCTWCIAPVEILFPVVHTRDTLKIPSEHESEGIYPVLLSSI
jgi:hypothetical protein